MAFESWDDTMLWYGSLIGYMAGVKSACKDEDKSSLLLRMADIQARLELIESKMEDTDQAVEDVLREFAEKIIDSQIPGVHPTYEETITKYAAKLRLAEVDE